MSVKKELISRILTAFIALAQTDKQFFHPKDVEMVQLNDWWIERFITDNSTEESVKRRLVDTMEWRKEYGVNDLTIAPYKFLIDRG